MQFSPCDDSNIQARHLLEQLNVEQLVTLLPKMSRLNGEIAEILIECGWHWAVAENMTSFDSRVHSQIASLLIAEGPESSLALVANFQDFIGLDQLVVAKELIEQGNASVVLGLFEQFDQLDLKAKSEVIKLLSQEGRGEFLEWIKDNFESLHFTKIECGVRGSGTEITGLLFSSTQLVSNVPYQPELTTRHELVVDAGCVTFAEATPELTIAAVRSNVANAPQQWKRATPDERVAWTADVEDALSLIEASIPALSL